MVSEKRIAVPGLLFGVQSGIDSRNSKYLLILIQAGQKFHENSNSYRILCIADGKIKNEGYSDVAFETTTVWSP